MAPPKGQGVCAVVTASDHVYPNRARGSLPGPSLNIRPLWTQSSFLPEGRTHLICSRNRKKEAREQERGDRKERRWHEGNRRQLAESSALPISPVAASP